ncbi:hypothetical protein SSP35_21_00600 [Streptomyces sp. NBRC 110611]|uniref:hypothetical protein n=1 Tax=Streptomyces sp. NBRC 110611 TaxID=1621259 RepID=UPI000856FA8B|nr:hypothetical protein [Streptomyces sp. NBRC 110611]GAU70665.1 hypothetical protein SSP35_21_00600 [Streptomyces sp. NBRC 110611]
MQEYEQAATWIDALPRTRWLSDTATGTATLYGVQVIHGVTPVTQGRLRKFISTLTAST